MSTYSFVSRYQDVDFVRMALEAHKDTPYILAETRNRHNNKPLAWALLVNVELLDDDRVWRVHKERLIYLAQTLYVTIPDFDHPEISVSWLLIVGGGRCPGHIKMALQDIKRVLNPKDTITEVTLP